MVLPKKLTVRSTSRPQTRHVQDFSNFGNCSRQQDSVLDQFDLFNELIQALLSLKLSQVQKILNSACLLVDVDPTKNHCWHSKLYLVIFNVLFVLMLEAIEGLV